jgi:opacity protein-like surface antigen
MGYTATEMSRDYRIIPTGGFFRCFILYCPATISSAILGLVLITSSPAQERVRSSALQLPIQGFQRSPDAFFYVGPFQEILTGTAGVHYTDNVNLTPTDKISDLSFTLGLGLDTTWVISQFNQLQFTFGGEVAENFYGNGRNQLTFAVAPLSQIQFKFQVSDLQVRLYDQFSYTQNPTTSPTATNTANLNNLSNTIGVEVETDLDIALLSLDTNYSYNSQSGQTAQGQSNPATNGTRESLRVSPALTFRMTPTILYGINGVAARATGENAANVNSLNFGPFIKGEFSKHFEFDMDGGLALVSTKPPVQPTYYFSAAIRYRLNRHWQILISGSHDLIFTTGTDLTEQNLIRLATQLDLTRTISFEISPYINFGNVESAGTNSGVPTGPYTQLGVEAGLTWKPRRRWSTGLSYSYIRRESGSSGPGAAGDNYIQNSLALSVGYAF